MVAMPQASGVPGKPGRRPKAVQLELPAPWAKTRAASREQTACMAARERVLSAGQLQPGFFFISCSHSALAAAVWSRVSVCTVGTGRSICSIARTLSAR